MTAAGPRSVTVGGDDRGDIGHSFWTADHTYSLASRRDYWGRGVVERRGEIERRDYGGDGVAGWLSRWWPADGDEPMPENPRRPLSKRRLYVHPPMKKLLLQREPTDGRQHCGQPPVMCAKCATTFQRKSHLDGHRCTAERRPALGTIKMTSRELSCDRCGRMFGTRVGLNTHVSVMHLRER